MRSYLAVLFVAFALAACSATPSKKAETPAATPAQANVSVQQKAPTEPVVQFLLSSAAKDFHDHGPSGPLHFRNVQVGHITSPDGNDQYKLCGEFQQQDKAEWMQFVTIKTSGYEQYLGGQAESFCKGVTWDTQGDLSDSLQNQLDSMR